MRYDLDLIERLFREAGLVPHIADQRVEVDLGQGAVLCFQNAEREEDCLLGFLDTPWHVHHDLMFADGHGNCVELNYLDLPVALKEGRVLICESEMRGRIVDRWLIHSDCNDELKYVEETERIVARRAMIHAARK